MALANTDFVFYLSANRPEADVGASGGAIALVRLMNIATCDSLNTGSGERVKFVSSAGGDTTQTVAVEGYGVDGAWLSETVDLAGATPVLTVGTYKHLKKAVLSATCAGTITVTGNTTAATLFTVPIGELGASSMFLKATANAGGGAAKTLYEKLFVKNTNVTSAGVACTFYNATDNKTELTFAMECAGGTGSAYQVTGGTESATNRATLPTGGGTYTFTEMLTSGSAVAVGDAADGNMVAAEAQGIWVKLSLAAGVAPDQVCQMTLDLTANAS
jgi:hypothetical protein